MQYYQIYRISIRAKTSNDKFGTIVLGVRELHHSTEILGVVSVIRKTRTFMNMDKFC